MRYPSTTSRPALAFWQKVIALLAVFLSTQTLVAHAQIGLISAGVRLATMGAIAASSNVIEVGKGSYQLLDQSWHPAKMWLQGLGRLQFQDAGTK